MYECDKYRSFISDYIDGEILPDLRKELESHLKVCPSCNELVYQVKTICNSLHSLSPVYTSPEFDYHLQRHIQNLKTTRFPFFNIPYQNWKMPAMASLILLATLGFFLVFDSPGGKVSGSGTPETPGYNPASVQIPGKSDNLGTQSTNTDMNRSLPQDSVKKDSTRQLDKNIRDGVHLVGDKER